jgi:hypothetical protein
MLFKQTYYLYPLPKKPENSLMGGYSLKKRKFNAQNNIIYREERHYYFCELYFVLYVLYVLYVLFLVDVLCILQLSDLLLLCSPRKSMLPTSSSGPPQFGLRARFQVETLQVLEGDNLLTANTFYVRDDHKTVELYTASRRDKEEWLEALFIAMKSLYTRKASLRIDDEEAVGGGGGGGGGPPPVRDLLRPLDSEIGRRPPPHMQRLENVNKCADCGAQFSILKHKHNCRTCGAVRTVCTVKWMYTLTPYYTVLLRLQPVWSPA